LVTALRIGLTGGIGSGKSTVASLLVRHGATLVDTDGIARALTGPRGAAMPALRALFGDDIADAQGALDRERMRALAFSDASAKGRLEAVLHPMIGAQAERQAAASPGLIVFDVPLLVESGRWRAKVDRVLVVDCSEATQIERVMRRSGWTRDAVERVIAAQASRSQRRGAADAVILNDGIGTDELAAQVDTLWKRWCA
jgi:dephospho-CoA kinase